MDSTFFAFVTSLAQLPDDDTILRVFLDFLNTLQDKVNCTYLMEKEPAQGDFELVATASHIFGKVAFSQEFSNQAEELQAGLRAR